MSSHDMHADAGNTDEKEGDVGWTTGSSLCWLRRHGWISGETGSLVPLKLTSPEVLTSTYLLIITFKLLVLVRCDTARRFPVMVQDKTSSGSPGHRTRK